MELAIERGLGRGDGRGRKASVQRRRSRELWVERVGVRWASGPCLLALSCRGMEESWFVDFFPISARLLIIFYK
jgi:hypothetical protein